MMRRVALAGVVATLLAALTVWAEVPHLIRYQGQAVDASAVPLEGPYTLTFRLYDAQTAGTVVWQETQLDVPVSQGHFSALLGEVAPLTGLAWTQPLWLGVTIHAGDPNDPGVEMSPRHRITSVPLAMTAERLSVPVTTSTIADDANALVPAGAILLGMGTSCPSGYSRLSALDGRFLVAGPTYQPSAGGSNTRDLSHAHSVPSHSHPNTNVQCMGWNAGPGGPGTCSTTNAVVGSYFQGHATQASSTFQAGTGGAASMDIRPAYATVLLCQRT